MKADVIVVEFETGELVLDLLERLVADPVVASVSVVDHSGRSPLSARSRPLPAGVQLDRPERNLGFAGGVMHVLDQLSPERPVLVLNPDCIPGSGAIGDMLEALEAVPDCGMVGARMLLPDGSEDPATRRRMPSLGEPSGSLPDPGTPIGDGLTEVEAVSGAAMLVTPEVLMDVGGLDTGYRMHFEDLDWMARIRSSGRRIVVAERAAFTHHRGTSSARRPVWVHWHKHRSAMRFLRRHSLVDRPLLRVLVVPALLLRFLLTLPAAALGR